MKEIIIRLPVFRTIVSYLRNRTFRGSVKYWEARYSNGGTSGDGSYGKLAEFKAEVINDFVANHGVETVIEFGCGDGNQLSLVRYPSYLGFDISETAIRMCKKQFAYNNKAFKLMSEYSGETADLTLSLDVIYHLVEDKIFEDYMIKLFRASTKYIIIYSSDSDDNSRYDGNYIKHRKFSRWVQDSLPEWKLIQHIPNKYPYRNDKTGGSFADFFIYKKSDNELPLASR
jgi:hypothetical protein